jgi:hypothetical protein
MGGCCGSCWVVAVLCVLMCAVVAQELPRGEHSDRNVGLRKVAEHEPRSCLNSATETFTASKDVGTLLQVCGKTNP